VELLEIDAGPVTPLSMKGYTLKEYKKQEEL